MDITPQIPQDAQVIHKYGPGRFTIAGETYQGAVLVTPSTVAPWRDGNLPDWDEADFAPLLSLSPIPEVLLIGTGASMLRVSAEVRDHLRAHGISCDAMDTGAACRTYNILLTEGRRVAAVLVAI